MNTPMDEKQIEQAAEAFVAMMRESTFARCDLLRVVVGDDDAKKVFVRVDELFRARPLSFV